MAMVLRALATADYEAPRWDDAPRARSPTQASERVVVVLQTRTPPEWGDQPEPHGEVVTVHDGKVIEMVVYSTVDEALRAAGLSVPT